MVPSENFEAHNLGLIINFAQGLNDALLSTKFLLWFPGSASGEAVEGKGVIT